MNCITGLFSPLMKVVCFISIKAVLWMVKFRFKVCFRLRSVNWWLLQLLVRMFKSCVNLKYSLPCRSSHHLNSRWKAEADLGSPSHLTFQLVGGEFDLEANFIIQDARSIGCMVELLEHCNVSCQAEIWSMFTAILRKSIRNLQMSTEVGLIQQVLQRWSSVDDVIAGIPILFCGACGLGRGQKF